MISNHLTRFPPLMNTIDPWSWLGHWTKTPSFREPHYYGPYPIPYVSTTQKNAIESKRACLIVCKSTHSDNFRVSLLRIPKPWFIYQIPMLYNTKPMNETICYFLSIQMLFFLNQQIPSVWKLHQTNSESKYFYNTSASYWFEWNDPAKSVS